MSLFRVNAFHHIKSNWKILIGRVEINHVIDSIGRNRFDEFFRQQESFEQQIKDDERALNKLMKGG